MPTVTKSPCSSDPLSRVDQFQPVVSDVPLAPERAWAQKPSSMSYEEAASVPQAAILALQGLRARRLPPDDGGWAYHFDASPAATTPPRLP
ncbi:MAG TPA: hypothetical protein VHR39_02600 [Propionibacteriaceae bacterium]|nr:hypothetical protein [Propionibacteriaceae bacterium]